MGADSVLSRTNGPLTVATVAVSRQRLCTEKRDLKQVVRQQSDRYPKTEQQTATELKAKKKPTSARAVVVITFVMATLTFPSGSLILLSTPTIPFLLFALPYLPTLPKTRVHALLSPAWALFTPLSVFAHNESMTKASKKNPQLIDKRCLQHGSFLFCLCVAVIFVCLYYLPYHS